MLTFVAAAAVGGTGAFFSDEEVSEDNVFTAGELTLTANTITHQFNGDDTTGQQPGFTESGFSFELDDLKPSDEGTITYDLTNGSNDATVCVMVEETGNHDNGVNGPESDAGDTTGGSGGGELGTFLNLSVQGATGTLAALSGTWFDLGVVTGGDPVNSAIDYCFGEIDGTGACVPNESLAYNLAQTDSLNADVTFYAEQTRGNDFTCAELNINDDTVVVDSPTDFDTVGDTSLSTIGVGSWQNDDDSGDKTTFYAFFGAGTSPTLGDFTVDDIKSISYKTNKPDAQGEPDFYVALYTEPDGVDDNASWYGYRLNMEPYFSNNLNAPANTWNTWSTDAGTNQLTIFDQQELNAFGVATGQPTLQDLQTSTAFDWNTVDAGGNVTAIDYGSETVKAVSFQTGTLWDDSFTGNIDEAVIELNNGNTLTIDFEPAS